jgi:hypothetical protein
MLASITCLLYEYTVDDEWANQKDLEEGFRREKVGVPYVHSADEILCTVQPLGIMLNNRT